MISILSLLLGSFLVILLLLFTQIHTVAVGAAIGQACLLLAAGTKGKRFMMPHAKGMMLLAFLVCILVFLHFYPFLSNVISSVHLNSFSAMIQQPRIPSSGLMPASDVLIRAKEVS